MTEELKEEDILKTLKEVDIKDMLLLIADIVKATGKYMIDIGEAASKREKVAKIPSLTSDLTRELWGKKFVEDLPEDKLGPILKIIYKIGSPPDLSKIKSESPHELIKRGEEFVDFATKLKELLGGE